jgi:hypothetical protein
MRRRFALRRTLLVAVVLVAAYGLVGFLVAPRVVERFIVDYARDELGGEAVIGRTRVNPFLLRIELTDFRLEAPPARPLRFARLVVDLDAASLVRRAWTFGEVGLDGVALGRPGELAIELKTITARGARFDPRRRSMEVPRLELGDGRLVASLEADGSFDLARLVARPERTAQSPSAAPPWRFDIRTIEVRRVRVRLTAPGDEPPVAYEGELTAGALHDVVSDGDAPMRFSAALALVDGGTLTAVGSMARDLSRAEARIEATHVSLAPLRPLLARYAVLGLDAGRLSASAQATYRAGATPRLEANGALRVDDLLVTEMATGDRFLAWKTLVADRVAFALAPARLAVDEIEVVEPAAKIAIARDRTVNLAQVLVREARSGGPGPEAADGARFAAEVGRIRVRNGTVDFSDASLALPFAARVRRLNGTAVGISSDRASRAELRLQGRIEGSGAARVEGGLNAFDPRAFTDLRVEFDNVEMPPLSPYAATFAGRRIAAGRLWLDLRYRIADGRLDATNRIVMQDLALGERVAAREALDLPLDLAVSVLTDSRGRISVAVPVRGDVDNPRFSYRRLLREALAGLVTRVATAPFRALARLAGGGGEAIGSIHFEPGRARLLPPEREKLDQVAAALAAKPELRLVVHGPYDPRLDGAALRERQVRREVARALGRELERREDPGPVAYGEAATQRALESLLGADALRALERSFTGAHGREPERVNRLMAAFGKASPDREFYQAVFAALVDSAAPPAGEVERLAQRRSAEIMEYLQRSAGLAPERMEAAAPRSGGGATGEAVTAELGVRLGSVS